MPTTKPNTTSQTPHKIVFVESYPHVMAGQQRTLLSLLKQTTEQNVESAVWVPGEGPFVDEARDRGHTVSVQAYPKKLSRYGGVIYTDGLRSRINTLMACGRYVLQCRKQLKLQKPTAVFCNDMRGLLTVGIAARSLRIPVMIWDKLDKPHGILDWFQLPIATKNIIISLPVQNKYPRWQRWLFQKKIDVVSDGVELRRFENLRPSREKLGLGENQLVLGLIGTVTHRKGHDKLMAVLPELQKRFPHLHVLCVGSWTDNELDTEYFESLPNRELSCVEFLGQRNDIPDIMNALDILIIPSRYEGMGLVIVEAMACNKPVIGSNVGGIPGVVVDGETGLIIATDSAPTLFDCISRLVESAELRQQMGQAGRLRVEKHFDRQKQMAKVCNALLDMS